MAQLEYRYQINSWSDKGIQFKELLYVPEVDHLQNGWTRKGMMWKQDTFPLSITGGMLVTNEGSVVIFAVSLTRTSKPTFQMTLSHGMRKTVI